VLVGASRWRLSRPRWMPRCGGRPTWSTRPSRFPARGRAIRHRIESGPAVRHRWL